jgi:hypothetical protein
MCRICFIIHLVPLVHGNIFVCRNFGQNGDKYTHRRQVDMVGGLRATWAHRLAPQGRHQPPSATLALATSPIPRSGSTSSPMHWFKLVCINGHDGVVMDLEPSNWPPNHFTYKILTCVDFTTAFASQPRPYDQKVVKSRASRHNFGQHAH